MSQDEIPRENELEDRQGKLYPVGRALRRTFDAENHDSLGTDLTGLMLQLTRIDSDAAPGRGVMPPSAPEPIVSVPPPPMAQASPLRAGGWLRHLVGRLLR